MSRPKDTTSTVIPGLRYKDSPKALDWLCRAFGFERHLVVPGENGTIAHAQLRFGRGMIMLGSTGSHGGTGFDTYVASQREIGPVAAQRLDVVVDDADAHLARARAAGAEILLEISDQDYGGRDYTCRDLEGHIWTFGTYDPWA